jgi:NAD(P)H-hydrate epimerase
LIIGGSELFHAASKWSLDTASRFVDMVFYASVPQNNALIQQAKGEFWNGIVISREHLHEYAAEADVILIGPGMERSAETAEFSNALLREFPMKKWVIDAGTLQTANPHLFPATAILTPHVQELQKVQENFIEYSGIKEEKSIQNFSTEVTPEELQKFSETLRGVTIVLKGRHDLLASADQTLAISGGNAGMTKGGTGDVLAGLIAGLYCTNEAWTAAVVGSAMNKQTGDVLWQTVGPFFNASDLAAKIPEVVWKSYQEATKN